jgi:hypothetical protein
MLDALVPTQYQLFCKTYTELVMKLLYSQLLLRNRKVHHSINEKYPQDPVLNQLYPVYTSLLSLCIHFNIIFSSAFVSQVGSSWSFSEVLYFTSYFSHM